MLLIFDKVHNLLFYFQTNVRISCNKIKLILKYTNLLEFNIYMYLIHLSINTHIILIKSNPNSNI